MSTGYVRSCIRDTPAYVPGEQPQEGTFIKLNTNESPYPPPFDLTTIVYPELERLRSYPSPTCDALTRAASTAFGVPQQCIVAGNGSDELLGLVLRTFVDPGQRVAAPQRTYSLYEIIVKQHGALFHELEMTDEFDLVTPPQIPKDVKLVFIASPNPPRGNLLDRGIIKELCQKTKGVVVVDEAYVDFASENCVPLLAEFDNLIITRTLSKGYSLAGLRVGFALAPPALARYLQGARDSYSVDRIAQIVATKALEQTENYRPLWARICASRERLRKNLEQEECVVFPSDANFLLCSPRWCSGKELLERLRAEGILVRYFPHSPGMEAYLRITIGTDEQIDRLIEAIRKLRFG